MKQVNKWKTNERSINQASKQGSEPGRMEHGKGRGEKKKTGEEEKRVRNPEKTQIENGNGMERTAREIVFAVGSLFALENFRLTFFFGDVNVGPPLFVSCRTNDSTRGDAFKAPQICMSNKWIVGSGRRHPGNHAEAINIHKVERRNYALNPLSRILSLPLLANPCLPIPSQGPELWWSKKLACPYLWPPFPWLPLQTQTKTALCPWPSVNAQCKWTLFGRRKWTCDRFLALLDSHWLRQHLPAFMPSEAEPPALEPLLPRSSLMQ